MKNREELEDLVMKEFSKAPTETKSEMFARLLQTMATSDLERWADKISTEKFKQGGIQ